MDDGAAAVTSDSTSKSKIDKFFPKKNFGNDDFPVLKKECWVCNRQFADATTTSAIGKHMRKHCPGKPSNSSEEEDDYLFQRLFTHPEVATADLLELKAQDFFIRSDVFQNFLEELDRRAKVEGLTTPVKKVGRTPKQKQSSGKSVRARKLVKRVVVFHSDDEELNAEEENTQQNEDEASSEVAALPTQRNSVPYNGTEVVNQMPTNIQTIMNEMQIMSLQQTQMQESMVLLQTQMQEIIAINQQLMVTNRELLAEMQAIRRQSRNNE